MRNIISINLLIILAIAFSHYNITLNRPEMKSVRFSEQQLNEDYGVIGAKYAKATIAAQAAYNRLVKTLKTNKAISIVAEIDHQKNAKSVNLELDYTQLVLFGNPTLGTPLMKKNQLAGLDLPQKVLFLVTEDKTDIAIYNSVEYLSSRYGLEGVSTLPKISQALENLVGDATKSEIQTTSNQTVTKGKGIITKDSNRDFETTYSHLREAIAGNSNIKIMAELDHKANAAKVGLELPPTTIVVFGNPNLGTPLMQSNPTVALDLPQKLLIWEDDKGVHVSYNDPYYIAERHNLSGVNSQLETISAALDNLSNVAAGL